MFIQWVEAKSKTPGLFQPLRDELFSARADEFSQIVTLMLLTQVKELSAGLYDVNASSK